MWFLVTLPYQFQMVQTPSASLGSIHFINVYLFYPLQAVSVIIHITNKICFKLLTLFEKNTTRRIIVPNAENKNFIKISNKENIAALEHNIHHHHTTILQKELRSIDPFALQRRPQLTSSSSLNNNCSLVSQILSMPFWLRLERDCSTTTMLTKTISLH